MTTFRTTSNPLQR